VNDFFEYAERYDFALVRLHKGGKNPVGDGWQNLWSKDRKDWEAWVAEGHNVGVHAGASRLLIVDADTTRTDGRDGAWARKTDWYRAHDLPVYAPHCSTARQGMHTWFRLPAGVDEKLTGHDLAEGINVLVGNKQGVAPGSYYDGSARGEASGHYSMFPDAPPPHEAPAALIEHCRKSVSETKRKCVAGEFDAADVGKLYGFLTEHDEFADYDTWVKAGMSAKLACGDDGREAWAVTHDGTVTNDVEEAKWKSFAYEPTERSVTIGTFLKRAHDLGWSGNVRRSLDAMFGPVAMAAAVAQIAANTGASLPEGTPMPGPCELEYERPVIQIAAGRLHELATAGEQALIAAEVPFYAHADEIQRPIVDEVEASRGRRTYVARFTTVTIDVLRDYLSRVAQWKRYTEKHGLVADDPPRDVAAIILSREGEWRFPRAAGVITTPTLRPDGTILCRPGYDAVTRLILLCPPTLPKIQEAPTRTDAMGALQILDDLLAEFPFVDGASRSVALSELITPVVRGAMSVAPLHANRAPTPGSGKSYILDVAAAISSGQPCPVISAGTDEFEMEKRLGAALIKGQAIISIDNLNGELRGDALCQMIERPIVEVRVLGQSKLVTIESKTTLFATGNNITLVGDVVRRVLLCSLDANLERPELRQFKRRPFDTVMADRGTYIAAALTVVRGYLAAGCPDTLPALASFEDWSRLVRSALVWLGRADPVATIEGARSDDPDLDALRRVVAGLRGAVGINNPQSAGQLKELAEHTTIGPGGGKPNHPALNEAFMSVASVTGKIDTRRLGKWLGQKRGRIIDGLKLMAQEDNHTKQMRWYLAQA
jgi:putative DNA primase/helicase